MENKIWVFGANNAGQLGLGYCSEQVSSPTQLPADIVDGRGRILSIQGGGSHTLILVKNTSNSSNVSDSDPAQLNSSYEIINYGLVSTKHSFPSKSAIFTVDDRRNHDALEPQIECGWDFSLFLNSDGQVYSAGDNTFGQLGRNVEAAAGTNGSKVCMVFAPVPVESDVGHAVQIAAGLRHSVIISKQSTDDRNCFWAWGDNSKGQCGITDAKVLRQPTKVLLYNAQDKVISPTEVRCGKYFTIVLGSDGTFYGCGLDKFGIFAQDSPSSSTSKCNNKNVISKFMQLKVNLVEAGGNTSHVKDFKCGWNHILVLLEDGRILSWGRNNFGQLGRKFETNSDHDWAPSYVVGLPDHKVDPVVSISCGSEHNLVLCSSGNIYTWGWNEHENCGVAIRNIETDHVIKKPTKVGFNAVESKPKDKQEFEKVVLTGCGAGNSFAVS